MLREIKLGLAGLVVSVASMLGGCQSNEAKLYDAHRDEILNSIGPYAVEQKINIKNPSDADKRLMVQTYIEYRKFIVGFSAATAVAK